jgi:hypothetical protein
MGAGAVIRPEEASEQLAYVRRTRELARLRVTRSHDQFMVWGAAWMLCYVGNALWATEGTPGLWPFVSPMAGVVSGLLGFRERRLRRHTDVGTRLPLAVGVIMVGLLLLPPILMRGVDPGLLLAYFPYVFGLAWLAFGVFLGRTYLALGALLLIASLVSLPMDWETQGIFLGVTCGGGMLAFGVWLRWYVRVPPEP